MKKGNTIYQFLLKCLEVLRPDFSDLRSVTADQLMYVKEDLIIPQTNTFYDFIVTKVSRQRERRDGERFLILVVVWLNHDCFLLLPGKRKEWPAV